MLPTQIDLRPLGEAELHVDRTFSPEQVMGHVGGAGARPDSGTGTASDDEFSVLGPVTFKGTLTRSGDRFRLKGRISATLQLSCGRCLTPFPRAVDTTVDLTYIPERPPVAAVKDAGKGPAKGAKAPAVEEDVELQEEDLDTAYYRDHVLDLAAMLRDAAALPSRLPGAVPELRHRSQRRHVPVPDRLGGSAALGAQGARDPQDRLTTA
jgi:hypothetical protein